MPPNADKPTPERISTDDSLKAERDKTDAELDTRQKNDKAEAGQVLRTARSRADDVVDAARAEVDAQAGGTPPQREALKNRRAEADRALQAERAQADAIRDAELAERKRVLDDLLRLERESTDEDLLEERARADEALTTRDLMLAMVSHDLRNMLASVALNTEATMREMEPGDAHTSKAWQRAQRTQRSVARMNRLLGDLLDVASIDEGKLPVQPKPNDLVAVVDEAVELFRGAASARSVRLVPPERAGAVKALLDHDRIIQVLGNLLGNAIKFTPAGGQVRVALKQTPTEVEVRVTDTGPGIQADHLESIFGRYFQVGSAQRSGLGLGLYISRCIVDSHGGRIWAECKPGEGATLVFTLPAV